MLISFIIFQFYIMDHIISYIDYLVSEYQNLDQKWLYTKVLSIEEFCDNIDLSMFINKDIACHHSWSTSWVWQCEFYTSSSCRKTWEYKRIRWEWIPKWDADVIYTVSSDEYDRIVCSLISRTVDRVYQSWYKLAMQN